MHWLIQEGIFEYETPLLKTLKAKGHNYTTIEFLKLVSHPDILAGLPTQDIIITGSVDFIKRIKFLESKQPRSPGTTWTNLNHFACSFYYPELKPYLLNSDFIIGSYPNIKESFNRFMVHGEAFVRPDKGDKIFTGGLYSERTFIGQMEAYAPFEFEILISSPKRLFEEWRFVVLNKKVIAGSRYFRHSLVHDFPEVLLDQDIMPEAWDYARHIAEVCTFNTYVMDVCTSQDGLKVVELNSFNCADFYSADTEIIVDEVYKAIN